MSKTSKIAAMAASLSMVFAPTSAPLADTEDASPRDSTKITASIILENDEVFYSAIPDEALEIMAETKTIRGVETPSCGNHQPRNRPSAPPAPKSQRVK